MNKIITPEDYEDEFMSKKRINEIQFQKKQSQND